MAKRKSFVSPKREKRKQNEWKLYVYRNMIHTRETNFDFWTGRDL